MRVCIESLVEFAYFFNAMGVDVTIVEGISGLDGNVGQASLKAAEKFDALTVAMIGYRPDMGVEEAVMAKELFGNRLIGVVLNGITKYKIFCYYITSYHRCRFLI